jgi:ribA/ribD-fused uncharacterized protein
MKKLRNYVENKMSDPINFYKLKEPFGCFSNFSRHQLTLKDQVWPTSEHYFQAQKFAGTKFETAVRKCDSPKEAADMGRDRALPLRADWETVKDDIMREAVYAKFSQNTEIKTILLSTGDAELIEHTKNDSYWADGGDGSGKNMLGKILMEVRAQLKKEMSSEELESLSREEELTKLEDEFMEHYKKFSPQIEAELTLAEEAVGRAVALAEEHGIPFCSQVSLWQYDNYIPKSFVSGIWSKMSELDDDGELHERLSDHLGFSPENYPSHEPGWESDGWSSSSLTC